MARRFTALLLAVSFGTAWAFADDLSDNFQSNLDQPSLDALAQDLGALMGGGSFHQGESLGFPLGFDIGVHVPVVGIQNEDRILRDNGSTADGVWGQLEVGLPFRIDVIGRAGKILDNDVFGGGLRWGLFKPSVPGLPAVSVSALYNQMKDQMFDAQTISANLVASFDLPFIRPYIGAGYDNTTLDVDDSSLDATSDGYRAEAGINLSLIPFTYITAGVGLANSQEMYHLGAGAKFGGT